MDKTSYIRNDVFFGGGFNCQEKQDGGEECNMSYFANSGEFGAA